MKTRAKKLAAILLAATLTAAMAVPAFAATDPVDKTGSPDKITEMLFDKIVETDADTYQPEATFSFTVEAESPTSGETAGKDSNNKGIPVSAGVDGAVTVNTVTTDPSLKGENITYSGDKGGKFTFDAGKFTQPGIYKYKVTETQSSAADPDMKYAEPQYLYVYVRWDSSGTKCEVYAASLVDTTEGVADTKSGAFTNTYKKTNKTEEDFKDLTISKTVTGSQGDTSKYFEFTLTITSGSNRKYYYVSNVADNTEEGKNKIEAGKPYTFKLKHDQSIVIENLSGNDSYTVTENDYSADGYTTKIGGTEKREQSETMPKSDTTVTFENNKEAVNPTGIIMNYGPYIAMIVAAAVLAFVFLRRKEEI